MAKPDSSTTQRTMLSDGPAPAAPRTACLVVIHGEGVGRRVDIDERKEPALEAGLVLGCRENEAYRILE